MKSVAILGHGTVGSGVYHLIEKNNKHMLKTYDEFLNITHVLVRDPSKYTKTNTKLLTTNYDDILNSDCEIIIETIGGIQPAYDYVKSAILKRKHVVTANKDLIAEHGEELMSLAAKYNVVLNYEASVGGSIPVLRTIKESLSAHKLESLTGILNGTTNYILSKMYNENLTYDQALADAQAIGFAEADPSSDVLGYDAARKLSILTQLATGQMLKVKDILIEGITNLDDKDVHTAKSLGYKIKLLSRLKRYDDCLHAFVKPTYVKSDSMLGLIDNEYNAVSLELEDIGEMTFTGKGAGKIPTASAIYGDILDILINEKTFNFKALTHVKICHYAQGMNNWLARLYSLNQPIDLEKVFKFFNQGNVEIKDFTDPHDLAFTITGMSETNLFDIMTKLRNLNVISVSKYFLML